MSCTIGRYLDGGDVEQCDAELTPRDSLTPEHLRILRLRSGVKKKLKFVCQKHYKKFYETYPSHQSACCDAFGRHSKPPQAKKKRHSSSGSLYTVTLEVRDKAKALNLSLIPGQKLCITCKIELFNKLSKLGNPITNVESSPSLPSSSQQTSSPFFLTPTPPQDSTPQDPSQQSDSPYEESLNAVNTWLSSLGLSPISEQKLKQQKSYPAMATKKLKKALSKYTNTSLDEEISDNELKMLRENSDYYSEIIVHQLKSYFELNEERSKKILALSVLPQSWSISKVESVFGASNRIARKTKSLVAERGILCNPDPKPGKKISTETVTAVENYYKRMDNSRELPGKKDVVSVRENGARVSKRKRLLLSTITDLYDRFITDFPGIKISKTKFTQLRPKECVLAGSSGSHMVCICTHHQNPKLMLRGSNLRDSEDMKTIDDCLKQLVCTEATELCFLRKCGNCPSTLDVQEKLELFFDSQMIENITYNQWESTDRGTIETITKPASDFIDDFIYKLDNLVSHDFFAKQQTKFYQTKLKNLQEGEALVIADFAENYSFIIQESAQSFYFNNKQATVHPFMCYYSENDQILKLPFVIISDCMDHNTVAVHTFQETLVEFLKKTMRVPMLKIYYFSDGSAAQYKNKKAVSNIWFHLRDFQVNAEWHFFATSHGKSPCDGLGGVVKRQAYLHSLRALEPGTQITTPLALYNWAIKNVSGINFGWVPAQKVTEHEEKLKLRFNTAQNIEMIQSHHALIPLHPDTKVLMKTHSNATTGVSKNISTAEISVEMSAVKGFVIYKNMDKWLLGYVTQKHDMTSTFTIKTMEPTSKKNSYIFESDDTEEQIKLENIMMVVNPTILSRGQVNRLSANDVLTANAKLDKAAG